MPLALVRPGPRPRDRLISTTVPLCPTHPPISAPDRNHTRSRQERTIHRPSHLDTHHTHLRSIPPSNTSTHYRCATLGAAWSIEGTTRRPARHLSPRRRSSTAPRPANANRPPRRDPPQPPTPPPPRRPSLWPPASAHPPDISFLAAPAARTVPRQPRSTAPPVLPGTRDHHNRRPWHAPEPDRTILISVCGHLLDEPTPDLPLLRWSHPAASTPSPRSPGALPSPTRQYHLHRLNRYGAATQPRPHTIGCRPTTPPRLRRPPRRKTAREIKRCLSATSPETSTGYSSRVESMRSVRIWAAGVTGQAG